MTFGLAAAILISACATPRNDGNTVPYNSIEKLAIESLRQFQVRSFTEKVEYCGWIYELNGELATTGTVRGEFSSCQLPEPPNGSVLLASYHTHGNHTPDYSSEFPSAVDVQGDFATDLYGFVATPGGRVWVVDPFDETIRQACGAGCLAVDPTYDEADYAYIPEMFTREMIYGYFSKGKGRHNSGK